jgi:hypothetical protein
VHHQLVVVVHGRSVRQRSAEADRLAHDETILHGKGSYKAGCKQLERNILHHFINALAYNNAGVKIQKSWDWLHKKT